MNWNIYHNWWFVVSVDLYFLGVLTNLIFANEFGFSLKSWRVRAGIVFWPVLIAAAVIGGTVEVYARFVARLLEKR